LEKSEIADFRFQIADFRFQIDGKKLNGQDMGYKQKPENGYVLADRMQKTMEYN